MISSSPYTSPIKSHFSYISHAQTGDGHTDQFPSPWLLGTCVLNSEVSSSSKYPLLRNSDKYSNSRNRSWLALCNELGHGKLTVN